MNEDLAVVCDHNVIAVIERVGAAALPLETGGLLLGWWEPGLVIVKHAIEVNDLHATSTGWCRMEASAQLALDRALESLAHPWLGFVGDWHTHPSPCPPSRTDINTITKASLRFAQPLVLLVLVGPSHLEVRAAHRGSPCPAILQMSLRDSALEESFMATNPAGHATRFDKVAGQE